MILSALNDYYDRLLENPTADVSPPGYSLEKIGYAIVLNREGEIVAVDDIRDTSGARPIAKNLIVPASFKRTGNVFKPFFLWDKTSYALGISGIVEKARKKKENREELSEKEDKELKKKLERLPNEHDSFKRFHNKVLNGTEDEGLCAFLEFLRSWNAKQFNDIECFVKHGEAFLDANVVFRLDGELGYLHERPAAHDLYSQYSNANLEEKIGICLVTGEVGPIARIHESIKGVKDAKSAGASIISFNKDSFKSYGKDQGENAPVSTKVACSYITALNYLLKNKRQRIQTGDATVVFWAQAANKDSATAAEDIFAAFMNPESDDAREADKLRVALELIRQGRPLSSQDTKLDAGARLFVLGLAPNASRLSIRFWETDTLDAFAERLSQHYEDIRLEPSPWKTSPAIWRLLLATAPSRDGKSKSEDVPAHLAGELARSILTGRRYPYSLLSNIVMRMRADGDISGARAALIKGVLTRFKRLNDKGSNRGELPVSLDTSNADTGYLLGRLFYLLENAQAQAISGANAGVKEKFYGSASATPALVYPSLMRNFQNHLAKLRKGGEKEKSVAGAIERDVANILDLLGTSFPKNLKLEDQGHFAIGYYHQSRFRSPKSGQDAEKSEKGEIA